MMLKSPRFAGLVLLVMFGGLLLLLVFFPPLESNFYPQCPLLKLTGLHCPACGALRAAHELMIGEWKSAFRYNPLMVVVFPFFAVAAVFYFYQLLVNNRFPVVWLSGKGWMMVLVVLLFHFVLINLSSF